MDEALRAVFDAGEAVVIRVRHELEPHQQRLLAALGAGYVVDAAALPCPRQCGQRECAVSAESPQIIGRHTPSPRAVGLGQVAPISTRRPFDPEPEKREPKSAEQLRAEEQERADGQPITTLCGLCDWRFEGTVGEGREAARLHREQAHPEAASAKGSRRNRTGWRRTANDNLERKAMATVEQRRQAHDAAAGRELLDRMDAGEPLNDDKAGLEEASEPVGAGAGASSSPEPGPAQPAPSPEGERHPAGGGASTIAVDDFATRRRRRKAYTREEVEAALRRFHDEHGRAPVSADIADHAYLPSTNGAVAAFGVQCWADVIEAMGWPRPTKGTRRAKTSEREPQAEEDAAGPTEPAPERPVSPPPGQAGEAASRSENNGGRARAWSPEDVLDAIRRWNDEYGHPPTSTEWMRRVDGYPTTTVASRFGSWANAIEQAGFDRPTRGGIPLRPLAAPAKRVRVRGTGLTYRTAEEAYVAADELEADGERVAEQARFDRNEAKAEQAIDQSRELAEKIRDAAHAFEARHSTGANGTAPMVEPEERLPVSPPQDEVEKPEERPDRLLVTPDDMPPFQRAIARSLIAGMRAAADALEQELAT